jgi:hypothetical protein
MDAWDSRVGFIVHFISFMKAPSWVAVQFGIGGISTAVCLDNRFNVGSYDSADLILRFGMKYSG